MISPYTGEVVPIAEFRPPGTDGAAAAPPRCGGGGFTEAAPEPSEAEELVPLEEADAEEKIGKVKAVVPGTEDDIELDDTIEDDDDDNSTFIADEEEGDEDVTDIIGDVGSDEETSRSAPNCVLGFDAARRPKRQRGSLQGAIAQLGERIVRMMRSAVRSRLAPPRFAFGYAWRSHALPERRSGASILLAKMGFFQQSQLQSLQLRVAQPRRCPKDEAWCPAKPSWAKTGWRNRSGLRVAQPRRCRRRSVPRSPSGRRRAGAIVRGYAWRSHAVAEGERTRR